MSARQGPIAIVSQPGLYPLQGFHGYNQRRSSQLGNSRFPQSGYAGAWIFPTNSDSSCETSQREYIWEPPPSYPGSSQEDYDGVGEPQHSRHDGDREARNGNHRPWALQQGNAGARTTQQANPYPRSLKQGNPGVGAPKQDNPGARALQQGNPAIRASQEGNARAREPQQGNAEPLTAQEDNPGAPEPQQNSQAAGSSPGATYNNDQSVVVINQGQLQTVRRRRLEVQIGFACCTIWLCLNPIFGLIGFIIARK